MAITGRLVALAALGLLIAAASAAAALGYLVLLVVLVGLDVALAARIADLRFAREPSPSVRLGEDGSTALQVTNTGRRALRGYLRDAWVPSAGVTPRVQVVSVPSGERRRVASVLTPTRRGQRHTA